MSCEQARRSRAIALLATALATSPGCGRAPAAEARASEGAALAGEQPSEGGLTFVDRAREAGIDLVNVSGDPRRWYIPESQGCGAAWLDYDGDGDVDLFVANGAGMRYVDDGKRLEVVRSATSKLYRNDGGWKFTDVTRATGAGRSEWINAVATGDVDNDGDPDLYLACFGADVFLRNDGGTFVDATKEAGLGCELWGAGAAFGDADNDGDLDLYVANYCEFDPEHPPLEGKREVIEGVEVGWGPEAENKQGLNLGAPDVFYRNDGSGHFVDATRDSGFVLEKPLCSYAAIFCDVDRDGWPDVLVANDLQPCNLFHNVGDGRFREEGVERGFAFDASGKPTGAMGLAAADIDGDGDLDVFKTNFDLEANSLYVNDGKGHFVDRADAFGLAAPSVDKLGWGCGFFDADLDGDLDLLVANGHVYPQAEQIGMHAWLEPTQLYECVQDEHGSPRYVDATASAGPGLAPLRSARGIAFADVDDDGDIDALVVDMDGPPRLLENKSARKGHWLEVRLVGARGSVQSLTTHIAGDASTNDVRGGESAVAIDRRPASNRDGIGARVSVVAGERRWTRELRTCEGLYSSNEPRLHFGLGPVDSVERVLVTWPGGRTSTVDRPSVDTSITIREPGTLTPLEASAR